MNFLIAIFLTMLPVQYLNDQPLTPVAFDGSSFLDSFNQTSDRARLVVILSPT
jgi:hypothetical protein